MTVTILIGDVREKLRTLPADSFDCVVTSPPYWGLRDYGTGRWEGGDPSCDHRSPTMREGRDEDRTKLAGSDATNSYQLKLAHRSACGKCGAVKVDMQIGLEPTLGEHLAVMVDVFREVRRVLKPSGTLWLNYGDCYATSPNGRSAADTKAAGNDDRTFRDKPFSTIGGTLKAKDLCMIPNRLAIALQDDGWWVRAENIWGKSNPMPESIRDRPATSHEKIFMLTKSARYFYAADEVRQGRNSDHDASVFRGGAYINNATFDNAAGGKRTVSGDKRIYKTPDGLDTGPGGHGSRHRNGREKGESVAEKIAKQDATAGAAGASSGRRMAGFNERWDAKERALAKQYSEPYEGQSQKDYAGAGVQDPSDVKRRIVEGKMNGTIPDGRNLRNYEPAPPTVWVMGTSPFSDAHFATFPPELVERCLKAGCPTRCCAKCGTPYRRVMSRGEKSPDVAPSDLDRFGDGSTGTHRKIGGQYQKWLDDHPLKPVGWEVDCDCNADVVPGRVLDPFGGAGTTALVADQMQLDATIIELNPDYVHIAVKRIEADRGAIQNSLDPLSVDLFEAAP